MIALQESLSDKSSILLGAGGHAKVVADLAEALGARIVGVCDPGLASEQVREWQGYPVLGDDGYLSLLEPDGYLLLNGVGKMPGSAVRAGLFDELVARGFIFPPLVHPAAWVSPRAVIKEGAQVMAGAVVQAGATLNRNCILNSASSVDHDSVVGEHAHIAPGVTVCGDVRIGEHSFLGAGSTVTQGVAIAPASFVKAGSLVTRDMS